MRFGAIVAVLFAVVIHAAFLLFGGLIFGTNNEEHQGGMVKLVSAEAPVDEPKKEEQAKKEEVKDEAEEIMQEEAAPDADKIISEMERAAAPPVQGLAALSLQELEAAISGAAVAGGSDSWTSFQKDLTGGGQIGGKGGPGSQGPAAGGKGEDSVFDMSEIDQKPRVVFQTSPNYPSEMRGKKIDGVVSVLFIVDASGKVSKQRAEKSTHPAFEKPALDAVRSWKFEPAIRGGQRVPCSMRVSIRFQQQNGKV